MTKVKFFRPVALLNVFYNVSFIVSFFKFLLNNKTVFLQLIAVNAVGASKNIRRFGQSIKRVVREVKEAEVSGKAILMFV